MSGLAGTLGDLVDIKVERPLRRRVELELQLRLLARLAQRRRLERLVARLDVAARLQKPPELRVLDETNPRARFVDDESRSGEVRARLVARERPLQLARRVAASRSGRPPLARRPRRNHVGARRASLVLERLEHVQSRSTPGREDRGKEAGDDRGDHEDDQRAPGDRDREGAESLADEQRQPDPERDTE